MPSLSQLATPPQEEIDKWPDPIMRPIEHPMPAPGDPFSPNPYLRCPLPVINTISPDTLRQFGRQSVPQTRMMTP